MKGIIMELWVCGKIRAVYHNKKGVVWDIQGVFDSETLAIDACKTGEHFIGPITLNKRLPEKGTQWPGCYFPKKGKFRME
jgi:hypothetical protein